MLVQELNPDNAVIKEVLAKIAAGDIEGVLRGDVTQVSEPNQVDVTNDVSTTSNVPDTNLLTPVNTVPNEDNDTANDTPASSRAVDTPTTSTETAQ